MQVTRVNVVPVSDGGKVMAYASITLDNAIGIKHIRLIKTGKGILLAMPSKKLKAGPHMDLVFPVNKALGNTIKTAVLGEYKRVKEGLSR